MSGSEVAWSLIPLASIAGYGAAMADNPPRIAAIVLAGGSGTRVRAARRTGTDPKTGPKTNKVYLSVGGRLLLAWSLQTLDAHPQVMSIVVAVRAGDEAVLDELLRSAALTTPVHTVIGGTTRSASERAALDLLRPTIESGALELVLIHDGARPFPGLAMVDRVVQAARTHGGAIPGLAPERPVLQVEPGGGIAMKLDQSTLRRVQTPQGFEASALIEAYDEAARAGFDGVDTAEVVAAFAGVRAKVVPGDPDNIKVTTAADLDVAEAIAARLSREGR